MNQRFNKRIEPFRPAKNSGNLYYARLNTPVGVLYKLGFTNLGSVKERLAYQGGGDEQYLDRVLFFANFENAADIEIAAHEHFGHKAAFGRFSNEHSMPLSGNGQSELYAEDILLVDLGFSKAQCHDAMIKIAEKRFGKTLQKRKTEEIKRQEEIVENLMSFILLFAPIFDLYKKVVFFLSSDSEKKKTLLINELMSRAQEARQVEESRLFEERVQQRLKLNKLLRELD